MSRIAARNGRIYANITSGGTAEPVAFLNDWTFDAGTTKIKVTAFGDAGEVYVAGLPDASGSYAGFFDDATNQFYTAAVDGVARKFYLYPSVLSTGTYWWGTAIFDFSAKGNVDGAVSVSGSWSAATPIQKVP